MGSRIDLGIGRVRRHFRSHRGECWFRRLCSHCFGCESIAWKWAGFTYSLAQRYGSSARILGLAHVFKSKGLFLFAIVVQWQINNEES